MAHLSENSTRDDGIRRERTTDTRRPSGLVSGPSNSMSDDGVEPGMINRLDKHERPKGMVAARLRAMGLDVCEDSSAGSFDLLVDNEIRVTLRVAYPGLRRHRVTVGGRSYRYRYETWHFNFHHHGRLDERYTDFFVCIATDPKDASADKTFVIPWEDVSGKTFSLHSGRSLYRGRYAPYRDGWDAIANASRARGLRHVA